MNRILILFISAFLTCLSFASPLPSSEAFPLKVVKLDDNSFSLNWETKPGYFLYQKRIEFTNKSRDLFKFSPPAYPKSEFKTDKLKVKHSIYRGNISLPVLLTDTHEGKGDIILHYQGCADEGFCYPPETKLIQLNIDKNGNLTALSLKNATFNGSAEDNSPEEDENKLDEKSKAETYDISSKSDNLKPQFSLMPNTAETQSLLEGEHWFVSILVFFGLGLLLSFTPCMLPMVPVLSGIIVGQGKRLSTRRAFLLSLSYVLSMSLTYALIGAVLASIGSNLQILMQSPWVIISFSSIFVLLALSLFGFYELQLPSSWQHKVSKPGAGGRYLGAILMGALSTLILSPCVTAPLIGVLGYITHHGSILYGSIALFFLGLGIGTPLILIGTSAGKWLPKSGAWMHTIKSIFGMLMLGISLFLLQRILPVTLCRILWASLFIFAGFYYSPITPSIMRSFGKCTRYLFSLILTCVGLLCLGDVLFNIVPLKLDHPTNSTYLSSDSPTIPMKLVYSFTELQQAIKEAKGTPVMVDFYADWCASCKSMEKTTLQQETIRKKLQQFVVLKVDLTSNKHTQAFLKNLNVVAPPTYLFFDKHGKELKGQRLVGEISPKQFLEQLNVILP